MNRLGLPTPDEVGSVYARFRDIGEQLLQMRSSDMRICTKADAKDLQTEADLFAENELNAFFQTRFPILSIEGEEGAYFEGRSPRRVVYIDPVDGTIRYAAPRLGGWGISSGIVDVATQTPLTGFIYFPVERVFLYALHGRGARVLQKGADKPIRRRRVPDCLSDAMVALDYSSGADRLAQAQQFHNPLVNEVRWLFSDCTVTGSLLRMVQGTLDVYVNAGATPYDLAGVCAIAAEAGWHAVPIFEGRIAYHFRKNAIVMSPSAALVEQVRALYR